jgi:hypothetical protein
LEPVADAWKILFMTTMSILAVIRRGCSKSRNVFWDQFGAGPVCIVLLSCFPQGNCEAERTLASVKGMNLLQRKRAISRGCLALAMALASVSRSVCVWGLRHNLYVYRASKKDPPTTPPAEFGSPKNHPLRDTQLRRALPQERLGAIVGGQRLSGFVPIILLPTVSVPLHFKRAWNEKIELGSGEVIYA